MRDPVRPRRLLIGLVLMAAVGCNPEPLPPAVADASVAAPTPALRLTSVLALRPQTRTIMRPYAGGVLVGQAGGEFRGPVEALKRVAGDGVRAVPFDAAAIAKAADAGERDVLLRDVWAGGDGQCLVLVNGYSGGRPLLGLWAYRPGGGLVRVADARDLGRVTGLGDSAQLADGRLVGGGRAAWLLLSVYGETSVVRIALDGGVGSTPTLRVTAGRLVGEDGKAVGIDDATLWPAGEDRAVLVRPGAGENLLIDLPRGLATATAGGLPAVDVPDEGGRRRRWAFTPATGAARTETDTWAAGPERMPTITRTPEAGPPVVVDRDAMRTRLGFPTHALRLTNWCAEPGGGRVLAYDAMSGEVFRIGPE